MDQCCAALPDEHLRWRPTFCTPYCLQLETDAIEAGVAESELPRCQSRTASGAGYATTHTHSVGRVGSAN